MVKNCYMGKVLMVDLTSRSFEEVAIDRELYRQYIGGYGLGVRILYERIRAGADPLGEDNILGFTVGPLTGTRTPSAGRFMVVGKSPLTYGWGDSNCGGSFGQELKRAGYDGVFFLGRSEYPVYIVVDERGPEIRDARHLWGRDAVEVETAIQNEVGPGTRVACIGQAGERLCRIAAIMHDGGRAAARSGLGAVMGSKNLKAVAVKGYRDVSVAGDKDFEAVVRRVRESARRGLSPVGELFREFGTAGSYVPSVLSQDAPIRNWKGVVNREYSIDQAKRIGGEQYKALVKKRYACSQCLIGCGALMAVRDARGDTLESHRPEYETIAAFGSMCLNDDLQTVIEANHLCNRYGLDTISTGAAIAFAMECFERGIITLKETAGLPIRWGDGEAILTLIDWICTRKGIGDMLAEGVRRASERLGGGAAEFAMHTGGQELPMHDPRNHPGWGYTYELDPTPGRHTQGGLQYLDLVRTYLEPYRGEFEGIGERYDRNYEQQGKVQALLSQWYHFLSCTGACLFAPIGYQEFPLLEIFRAATGWSDLGLDEALLAGERINTLRHCFNLREGLDPGTSHLPLRVRGVPPLPSGPLAGVSLDTSRVRRGYYEALGYDPVAGRPLEDRLKRLGLHWAAGSFAKR